MSHPVGPTVRFPRAGLKVTSLARWGHDPTGSPSTRRRSARRTWTTAGLLVLAASCTPKPTDTTDAGVTDARGPADGAVGRDAGRQRDGAPPVLDGRVVTSDAGFPDSTRPDAGTADASPAPDAAVATDAAGPWDASPAADASPAPDATVGPDAAVTPDAGSPKERALAALRDSVVNLDHGWRFRTDPSDQGVALGYADPALDDSGWETLSAGRTWEEQGHAGYDGVAFYRHQVVVPADWQGSPVRLVANGIDDEVDIYVNGLFIRHRGSRADNRSVYGMRTDTEVQAALRFGESNLVALRVTDWEMGGGLVRHAELRRARPMGEFAVELPEPVVDGDPLLVDLYWTAWQLAFDKVSFGSPENGFVTAYMDEGFNEQIYQWDSSFITVFGRYGLRLFPVMETLDNFYAKQRPDGYIQRVYSETDGRELVTPSIDEPVVNPPLFAWVEWEYFRMTGDDTRLARVFPLLERYFHWLKDNVRGAWGQGLYYQTGLGCGMDNTPRGDVDQAGWEDMSMQQALAALSLSRIATRLGLTASAATWQQEHASLRDDINRLLWHDLDGMYYDLTRGGGPSFIWHIGAFWALLSDVAGPSRAPRLIDKLKDPARFYRPHLFPSLAAHHPEYDALGHYWQGGVWAPTNYMVIKGLEQNGERALAQEAALNHLHTLRAVYDNPPTDEATIAPEERDGDYRTLWECYAPESARPGTRWDGQFLGRQDFVGWTGLGPIALLIENVLGVEVVASEDRVTWHLSRTDRHGVLRLPWGARDRLSLTAAARAHADAPVSIHVESDRALSLVVERAGHAPVTLAVSPGASDHTVP